MRISSKIRTLAKSRLLLFLLLIVFLVESYLLFDLLNLGKNKVLVEFDGTGFKPNLVNIKPGQTVEFRNISNTSVWPASNLHPQHTIYPEFDPRKPVKPNESWSFKFNLEGEWDFHDHLASQYTGKIIVGENNTVCNESENKCWEEIILTTLEDEGLEAAFEQLSYLYDKYPEFKSGCHSYTHLIGDKAAKLYQQDESIPFTEKASACGYGFYHGFMEELLIQTGDLNAAREYCDYVTEQTGGDFFNAGKACFHGFGHGIVDGSDPTTWGDVHAMIEPGLKLCEKIGRNDTEKDLCASGVFNSIAILSHEPKYGIKISDDPYGLCEVQTKDYYKKPCYEEMNTVVLSLGENNLKDSLKFTNDIQKTEFKGYAVTSLAGYAAFFQNDAETIINTCRTLISNLGFNCLRGYVGGLLEKSSSDRPYQDALEFCQTNILNQEETSTCYSALTGYAIHTLNNTNYASLCNDILQEYKVYCDESKL